MKSDGPPGTDRHPPTTIHRGQGPVGNEGRPKTVQEPQVRGPNTRFMLAEERTEQAEARTEQAEARTEQAEARTEQAKTRTEQAEARTERAESRTEQAKTRTEQAEARTELAETRSEQAIRDSELSYRRLFEAAKEGILILEAGAGTISDVNPFLTEMLGFSHGELVGTPIWELGPFRDIVCNKAKFEELQQQGCVISENLSMETKSGRKIAVEFASNVYLAGDKNVIQCNVRDITERKRLEQRLTLLNTCISILNDTVIVTEADPIDEPGPRIVFVNEAFEKMTGYTSAEAVGRSPRFLHGEKTDSKTLAEIDEALRNHRPIRRKLVNYSKNGAQYWADVDIVPIFEPAGRCTHFAAIERDITAEKRNEARFRRLVDSNAQGVIFWNTDGTISGANDAFLGLVGHTREELAAGLVNWAAMTPPQYASLDRRSLEDLAAKGVCTPYEKEFIRKDGSRVPVLLGAAMFEDNPHEGVCFVLDLTERKALENQFLRSQRIEGIGMLAGGIAHDLNNILAPILMSIEVLRLKAADLETTSILETIETSAKRGADIVRQVLSFGRGLVSERTEVQIKSLIKDIETIFNNTFPKNIHLVISLPATSWTILGDPTQLHQIILNLCVNARDAMPAGGTLTITSENVFLDEQRAAMCENARPGRYVNINVADSGTGIHAAILKKIFEPFFTTKEAGRGTGLGLSTVKAIVKSHNGFVTVHSELGKGTTFEVYLPALEGTSKPWNENVKVSSLPRGNGETVLVVDDEASILAIASQTLKAFGYRVLTATDGAAAVAMYIQHRQEIAVVLTDTMMPVMDGTAMIQALSRINPAIKVVAASGRAPQGRVSEQSGLVLKHFLPKPYTAESLLKTIRQILDEP